MREARKGIGRGRRVEPRVRANFVGRAHELSQLEREIARAASVRARAVPDAGAPPPEGVQHLIERRLADCDPSTRLLVELAAVIGRDFPLALAQRLAASALGEARIAPSAVDRALAAHLLEPAEAPDHLPPCR